MTDREKLLGAVAKEPGDDVAWLALADSLEEDGQMKHANLLRLTRQLRGVGRTVFDGTHVEEFKAHILGVIENIIGTHRNLMTNIHSAG